MKYTLKGKEYTLKKYEVTYTKKMVASFIKRVRQEFSEKASMRAYTTFLVIMMVMAQDCLNQFDTEDFDRIFKNSEE